MKLLLKISRTSAIDFLTESELFKITLINVVSTKIRLRFVNFSSYSADSRVQTSKHNLTSRLHLAFVRKPFLA